MIRILNQYLDDLDRVLKKEASKSEKLLKLCFENPEAG